MNSKVFATRTMTIDPPGWLGLVSYPRLLLDSESTGFSKEHNRIVQLGQLLVHNAQAKLEDATDVYIQTPYDPVTWGAVYLREGFKKQAISRGFWSTAMVAEIDANAGSCLGCPSVPIDVQMAVNPKGKRIHCNAYDITGIAPAKTMSHGRDRVEVFTALRDLLVACFEAKVPIMGHNIVNFDLPFIEAECVRAGIRPAPIDWEFVVDTGYLIKAAGLQQCPHPFEDRRTFYRRMNGNRAKGLTWSLTECLKAFGIESPDARQHSSAGYDCYLVHQLAEAFLLKT